MTLWPRVAGPELAEHTLALGVQGGTLLVAVRDGTWATQLAFFRTELVGRLKAEGAEGLRDIRFRVGFPSALGRPARLPQKARATVQATAEDWEHARQAIGAMRPGPLTEQLERLYVATAMRRRRLAGILVREGSEDARS